MRPDFWLLRWRFEYHSKPVKYGQWNRHGDFVSDQAWSQSRDGLAYACIEGKEFHRRESKIFARCPSDKFINFQWIAAVKGPVALRGSVTQEGEILGLGLVTVDEIISVFRHGGIEKKKNNEDYSKVHLAGFGR